MSDIQRYEAVSEWSITKDDSGSYVNYDDHAAIVAQLEADIAEAQEQIERKNVYLEATLQLFKKVDQSPYVIPVLYELAHYDEADCDGFCLANEIAIDLGFDEFRGYKEQQ